MALNIFHLLGYWSGHGLNEAVSKEQRPSYFQCKCFGPINWNFCLSCHSVGCTFKATFANWSITEQGNQKFDTLLIHTHVLVAHIPWVVMYDEPQQLHPDSPTFISSPAIRRMDFVWRHPLRGIRVLQVPSSPDPAHWIAVFNGAISIAVSTMLLLSFTH